MSDDAPRAKTAEEVRSEFLQTIAGLAAYWAGLPDKTPLERCNGLAFSILSQIDGSGEMPSLDLMLAPHEEDAAYHREIGENWYEAGQLINDTMLHEQWHHYQQRTP